MCLIPPLCSQYEAIGPTSGFCQYETKVPTSGFCKYETYCKCWHPDFLNMRQKCRHPAFVNLRLSCRHPDFVLNMWQGQYSSKSANLYVAHIFTFSKWGNCWHPNFFRYHNMRQKCWNPNFLNMIQKCRHANFLKTSCKKCANLATPPLQGYIARGILTFPGNGITPGEIDT